MLSRRRLIATSLLTRILLVEALTILVACIVLPLLARAVMHGSVARIEEDMLRGQARTVANGLRFSPQAGWRVELDETLRPIYATGYDGRAYAVVDAQRHVVIASPFARPRLWPAGIYRAATHRFEAGTLVGLNLPIRANHASLWVIVTQDQARPGAVVDDVVRSFLSRYLIVLVLLLAVMPVINGVILWHSFEKLRRVARVASEIHPATLDARLETTGLPAEARALVHATNGLLGRVETAFHQQEEFAGNVAHELRTPLAALRFRIDTVAEPDLREELTQQVERMSHVISQLRDLAGLESAARAGMELIDLTALVIDQVAEMTPQILTRGRTIAVGGAEAAILVKGNRGLLVIALRNLIDNALDHTPGGTCIEVRLGTVGSLTVADDGPGVAEADPGKLSRRFWRADHRRSDGAGLGLSIVQRIVEAHHGRLEIGTSSMGGASFTLHLQRA